MIVRTKSTVSYTVIPNSVFDHGLSPSALGVLCYLLSKPPLWKISAAAISKVFGVGRFQINRVMAELQAVGLAVSRRGGKLRGFDWYIYDVCQKPAENTPEPAKKATIGFPDYRVSRQSGFQHLLSTEEEVSTEEEESTDARLAADAFASFWRDYPRKVGKVQAEKAWRKLSAKDRELASMDIKGGRFAGPDYEGARAQFIPHASTYLNNRRWEDEDSQATLIQTIDIAARNARIAELRASGALA